MYGTMSLKFIRCFAGDNKIFLYIHRQGFDTMFQKIIRPEAEFWIQV